jgi:hypothetical protein
LLLLGSDALDDSEDSEYDGHAGDEKEERAPATGEVGKGKSVKKW